MNPGIYYPASFFQNLMPLVEFMPAGKKIEVPVHSQLLDAARLAGVEISTPCGGEGTCGKCVVTVLSGRVDSDSLGQLPGEMVADGQVLACRTRLPEGTVVVEVGEPIERSAPTSHDDEETCLVRKELMPKDWDFDPLAAKWRLKVPAPQPGDGLSDLDRITRTIQHDWGKLPLIYSLSVMREVASALRVADGLVTVTLIREPNQLRVIRIEPGDCTTGHYAIAVDVGTTTVAAQLISLTQGKILGTCSDYNGQIVCGSDVISRINYARRREWLLELQSRVLHTVNRLIREVCRNHGVEPQEVCNAVISGNTVMTHLVLGLNPEHLRLNPYVPTVKEVGYLAAAEVGIEINPDSWIYFSPSVGSYVGGDITAGLLCTDLATDSEAVSLFIDIGTNGEIVIGNCDFLMGCACSAGPAFEGGGVACGMRAALGAIEAVAIDRETGQARCSSIGGGKPKGICGSGMIDLLANLYLTGWIDPSGKLNRGRSSPYIEVHGRRAMYVIVPAEASGTGKPIFINETDIENILRAKASIYSAVALMLKHLGISIFDLTSIYIGGGFGRYLDLENAIIIGLLPDLPRERFHYIGNSSLMGSYMVVVSQDYRLRQLRLARRMTYLELNTDPSYMDEYTGALFLPHTNLKLFPSVKERAHRGNSKLQIPLDVAGQTVRSLT